MSVVRTFVFDFVSSALSAIAFDFVSSVQRDCTAEELAKNSTPRAKATQVAFFWQGLEARPPL